MEPILTNAGNKHDFAAELKNQFGGIDVYLFDQLQRGRLRAGMAVLDAGCGGGRNLPYLLRGGCNVHAVDADPASVEHVRGVAQALAPQLPRENFAVAQLESLPYSVATFDFVICNAVLHFAHDETHLRAMVAECARVLRPGGIFFARLMSTAGIEDLIRPLGGRRYALPNGQSVVLVDEGLLLELTANIFNGELADPLKSTVVHGQRTMTTWVVKRGA